MILDIAKSDHRTYVGKIKAHLTGDVTLNPLQLADPHQCRFGRWYYGEGMKMCGNLPSFKALEDVHAKIHALGKEVVSEYNAGDKAKAEKLYRELEDTSNKVISLLDELKSECRG